MSGWHIRAVRLPDGDGVEDAWLSSEGWSDRPFRDADDLPGGFALAGLVDAHSHASFGDGGNGPVEAPDLVRVALEELAAGATWVKLVADFSSAAARGAGTPSPEPTYDLGVVRELIEATHGAGGRVAAHVTTELVAELVNLGIDSVEYGTALDEDTLDEMAARGTAWTPTLRATLSLPDDPPEERTLLVAERRERFRHQLPRALRAGIPVLTGSDVVGSVPAEVALLVGCGLEPIEALRAATTAAVGFLGVDVPPAVVTYAADPREDPEVLTRPAAVVIGGVRVC
jgi:imidazolonepropionase-like amidohydrolase